MNIISMNTALPSSHIYQERECRNYTCFQVIPTNNVSPRDSQDDKILLKHIKSNPKLSSFFKHIKLK